MNAVVADRPVVVVAGAELVAKPKAKKTPKPKVKKPNPNARTFYAKSEFAALPGITPEFEKMSIQNTGSKAFFKFDGLRYPSDLLANATQMHHVTDTHADADGHCAFCGKPHAKGDAVAKLVTEKSFNDIFPMANRTGKYLCGGCQATWIPFFQTNRPKMVISERGMFSFASNNDIAYWLTNPPEGPFLMYYGNKKSQHIAWKSPVNLSRDLFFVQFGDTVFTIRREAMLAQRDAALRLIAAVNTERQLSSKAHRLNSPFVNPVRAVDDLIFGVVRGEVLALVAAKPEFAADLKLLQTATPGEVWAMSATLYADPGPHTPTPVTIQMVFDSLTKPDKAEAETEVAA